MATEGEDEEEHELTVATCDGATLTRIARALNTPEGGDGADRLVWLTECAARLGSSRRRVSNLLADGSLPAVKLPGRVRVLGTHESALRALIEGGPPPTLSEPPNKPKAPPLLPACFWEAAGNRLTPCFSCLLPAIY